MLSFGSRLEGYHKPFSDLDLSFICKDDLGLHRISNIEYKFSESDLPYRVDVLNYKRAPKEFQEIIDANNEKIYG
ncbi:MAG: nucleotidyltransferase domain-containing protein [Methanobrevibacter sp.]|nr:nucleotidyltransferase domain-containing protein [Candidatus Methanovirga aequatorialis]